MGAIYQEEKWEVAFQGKDMNTEPWKRSHLEHHQACWMAKAQDNKRRLRKRKKWCRLVMSSSLQPHGLYSIPGSSIYGIFQARVLEWVAISFSRGSSRTRIEPGSPTLQTDALPSESPGKPLIYYLLYNNNRFILKCLRWRVSRFVK